MNTDLPWFDIRHGIFRYWDESKRKWLPDPDESLVEDLRFELKRTKEALETANKILAEHGLIGVLVDLINPDPNDF